MKAISSTITKGVQVGSFLKCADNTGADIVQIIAVKGYHGVARRIGGCGVGGLVSVAVKRGNEKIRHEVSLAVVIRQTKEFRRKDGTRVKFEDNAAVLVNEKEEARGTRIKGAVAREAIERFSTIGKIATIVV